MTTSLKSGDFTGLAKDYSQNRPGYCPDVLLALLGLHSGQRSEIDFADVGAGTGIWTRMVWDSGVRSVIAVEPNEDMRSLGIQDSHETDIRWLSGCAESTGLENGSIDWVTMASSFHWADFDLATKEFHRILRPRGYFTALWNPRLIELNPLLVEIEARVSELQPKVKRVSSGLSGITETISNKLWSSRLFDDVIYIEGRHVINMTPDRYLGAWRSVNDLRVQLGPEKFSDFLKFVEERVMGLEFVEATYLTRAWSARKVG